MRRLKRLWRNIPRPIRAVVNILGILFLILTIYYCMGTPAFSLEQGFRRQEKAHLVGPGQIVDHLDWSEYPQFHDILVAETEHGVTFYAVYESDSLFEQYTYEIFSHREKTGDLTVLAPPSMWMLWNWNDWDQTVPIYLFDEYPEAVRAELDLHVVGKYQVDNDNFDDLDVRFSLETRRADEGFFKFWLDIPAGMDEELAAAQLLTAISTTGESFPSANTQAHYKYPYAEATVRLYDENDVLLVEEDLMLHTVSAAAQAERGEWE